MSKNEKLLSRLLAVPSDFAWDELVKVLKYFGYDELKRGMTGGSRRRFGDKDKNIITLHEPHPQKVLKRYAIKEVIQQLRQTNQLEG